jgi:parallel beta-helix repeat protein
MVSSSFNNITNNDIVTNIGDGIHISSGGENYIEDNTILDNSDYGVFIDGTTNNFILNNHLSNNKYGILLSSCSSNTLESNAMINNGVFVLGNFLFHFNMHNIETTNTVNGKPIYYWKNETSGEIPTDAGQIIIVNSSNIIIKNQDLANSYVGIQLGFSSNNLLYENNVSNNLYGIYLIYSNANNIINNTVDLNFQTGLFVGFSNGNNISGNEIHSNNGNGLSLSESNDNNITRNNMSLNLHNGLALHNSWRNDITENNIFTNQNYGIDIKSSQNNQIYHNNIINNADQADDDSNNMNQWDNGYPSGGNYWSDYVGIDNYKGPGQDIPGSDGIVDSNYSIDIDSVDNYPLIDSYVYLNQPPVASITASITNAYTDEQIIFNASDSTDPDGDMLLYYWDFDLDDGVDDDVPGIRANHQYSEPGDYIVTLTVVDENGAMDNASVTIYVKSPNQPPNASIDVSKILANVDEQIAFNASNSTDPNGDSLSYYWDFNASDGVNEDIQGKIVTHHYSSPGQYTVTLTVVDSEGAWDNDTIVIWVVTPNYPPTPVTLFEPLEVTHNSIRITWSQNNDTDFDNYAISLENDTGFISISDTDLNHQDTIRYNITNLPSNTTFQIYVEVFDTAKQKSESNIINVKTLEFHPQDDGDNGEVDPEKEESSDHSLFIVIGILILIVVFIILIILGLKLRRG